MIGLSRGYGQIGKIVNAITLIYNGGMDDVRRTVTELIDRGWTLAALADELGVTAQTVMRWKAGSNYPANARPVVMALEGLTKRRSIPKRKRY